MQKFTLTTDTSCDVLKNELDEKNIHWVPLTYTIKGVVYEDNFTSDSQYEEFYSLLKKGEMPITSQINVFNHEEFFEKAIENGAKKIIHLSLSSGLSNTVSSARIAAANVMEKHDDVKIYIIDTLSATQGHHLLLNEAEKLRDSGTDAEAAANYLEAYASKIHHWIVVDDLMHLKRGGRVSGPSAYVGSLLNIKPILIVNDKGKLAVVKKAKGTTKALMQLIEEVKKHAVDPDNAIFFTASADAGEIAKEMHELLKANFSNCTIKSGWIGPIIGAHTGHGTLGLVFLGKQRLDNN